MKTERVYSKNATYQRFEVLKTNRNKRYTYGEFWIEGVRNINEARKNGWEFSSLLFSREKPLSHWAEETLQGVRTRVNYELPLSLMRELSGKEDTSELLAIGKMRKDSFEELRLSPTSLLGPVRPAQQPRQPGHDFALVRRFGRGRPNSHGARRGFVRSGGHRGLHGIVLLRTHHPRAGKPKRV